MNHGEVSARLASHANLPATDIPEAESFIWNLWNAERTALFPNIPVLCDDVIACLKIVNHELNGSIPSESSAENRAFSVVSDVAYSVSGIIARGLQYHRQWSRTGKFEMSDHKLLEDACKRRREIVALGGRKVQRPA